MKAPSPGRSNHQPARALRRSPATPSGRRQPCARIPHEIVLLDLLDAPLHSRTSFQVTIWSRLRYARWPQALLHTRATSCLIQSRMLELTCRSAAVGGGAARAEQVFSKALRGSRVIAASRGLRPTDGVGIDGRLNRKRRPPTRHRSRCSCMEGTRVLPNTSARQSWSIDVPTKGSPTLRPISDARP